LYLFYGLLGIAVSGAYVPVTSTVARWFVKRRGLMTGVAVSGLGAGTLFVPLLATWLIASYGWRNSYTIVGIGALVLITLPAQLLRRNPSQMGMLPYGEDETTGNSLSSVGGFSFLEAFHTRQFWILAGIWLFYCLSIGAVMAHIVLYGIDAGLTPTKAAVALSFIGGFSTIGRILMGGAGDRIGFRRTLAICLTLMSAALFWLLLAKGLWMLYLFGMVYGFSYGGVSALSSPFVAEQFGLRSHGVILGVLMIASEVGESVSPVVTGYIFDVTGKYFLAFLLWAILTVGALVFVLMLTPAIKPEDSSLQRR
jgi:MFS family permease